MTDPTNGQTPREDDKFAKVDVDEYSRMRRLRQIYDARENAGETLSNARSVLSDIHLNGEDTQDERQFTLVTVHTAIKHYVMELEPLIVRSENGDEYWKEAALGSVQIPAEGDNGNRSTVTTREIVGLCEYLDTPSILEQRVNRTIPSRHGPDRTKVQVVETPLSIEIAERAYREANDFVNESGLSIEFDDEQQTKITRELLEEVDEWRRENIDS